MEWQSGLSLKYKENSINCKVVFPMNLFCDLIYEKEWYCVMPTSIHYSYSIHTSAILQLYSMTLH